MFWKKNVLHYVLWLFLAAVSLGGLFGLITCMTSAYQLPVYVSLLGTVGFGVVSYALMFFVRFFINHRFPQVELSNRISVLLEGLGIILCLFLGGFLCFLQLSRISGDARDLLYTMVDGQNVLFPSFHGASFLYLELLKKVCMLFGTDMLVCAAFQECILLLSCILLYVTVRRVAGRFPAFLTLLVGLCASYIQNEAGSLSPTVFLLFLLCILFFILSSLVKRQTEIGFLLFYPVGVLTGICGYLDCIGFLPLIFLLGLLCGTDEEDAFQNDDSAKEKVILFFGFTAMVLLGFIGSVFVDALLNSSTIDRILAAYGFANSCGYSSAVSLTFECGNIAECGLLLSVVIFAAIGFLLDKQRERIFLWVLLLMSLLVMQALGLSYSTVDINVYLMLFGAALGGVGISSFWRFERKITDTGVSAPDDSKLGSLSDWKPEASEQNSIRAEETEGEEVEFIENPLPVPKKHVARTLDYDIEVADDDDFDI